MESGGNSDVTLTDYILNPSARQQNQNSTGRNGQMTSSVSQQPISLNGHDNNRRAAIPIPEVRQVR